MFVGTLIVIAVVDNVRRRRSGKRRSAPEPESATPEPSTESPARQMTGPPPSYWHAEDAASPTRVR
jgi:hypothetical protein